MKKGVIGWAVCLTACRTFAEAGAAALPAAEMLTPVDWVLLGLVALLAVIGLFRGISGELGSLAGLVVALVVGYALYGVATSCADHYAFGRVGAVAIDFLFALLAFGGVRILVRKFVSFLVGKPADCTLGLLSGLFKGVVVLGLLTGIGILKAGTYSTGILTEYSTIIRTVAGLADGYVAGEAE